MKPFLTVSLAALLGQTLTAQAPTPAAPADYVVHEWGTFTSMTDKEGAVLEGLHHEEEHLPKFVHDLMKVTEEGIPKNVKLPASYVTQKMETPVIYFYSDSDEAMRAKVRVWFRDGLMTQFYPLPATIYPRITTAQKQLVDMRKVKASALTWDVDVLPRSANEGTTGVPAVAEDDPWHFARQTRANLVRTRLRPGSKAKAETEHYLFYRGLGRWQPDVTGTASTEGTLHFQNRMGQTVPFALALELGPRGGRFVVGSVIASGATHDFDFDNGTGWIEDREHFARRIGAHVLRALVDQGLYVDEARAMVATWSRSWFQTDGTRVIYLLPRQTLDGALILSLDPAPKELVRVMVGRHEMITPAAQTEVENALDQQGSSDPTIARRGAERLMALDRFLEPHLRNVARNGRSARTRRAAEAMLANVTR